MPEPSDKIGQSQVGLRSIHRWIVPRGQRGEYRRSRHFDPWIDQHHAARGQGGEGGQLFTYAAHPNRDRGVQTDGDIGAQGADTGVDTA